MENLVTYSKVESPYGKVLIAVKQGKIVAFMFLCDDETKITQMFFKRFPSAKEEKDKIFSDLAIKVLENKNVQFEMIGSDFEKSVWLELRNLKVAIAYQELAIKIGNRKATRAVANAVAKNPLHFLVPCHLVVRTGGDLGKYAGGLELKRKLISQSLGSF